MKIVSGALFCVLSATAFGQAFDPIRARITGTSGDRGKCTIEVVVDGVAEVEVLGDQGRLRTISGARATWRRMECNMPMPGSPGEFRYSPQTGRGRQSLVKEPGSNRGVAVVRIEDSEGGSQGYKFDLEWRGTVSLLTPGPKGQSSTNSNTSSIFDLPGNNNTSNQPSTGGVIDNTATAGWNDQVNFRATGDGYYRSFRGSDEMLTDAQVSVDRSGRVQVDLTTSRRERISLSGRVVLVNGDRLIANVSSGTILGPMEILLDSRNRVQELAMTGTGRNRFELRWQAR